VPLALAAVSVEGRCRERNPADLVVFGAAADQFAPRFMDPAVGQALLARASTDGVAETSATLLTEAGPQPFHISLWRQRGGERIRVIAAFGRAAAGACETAQSLGEAGSAGAPEPTLPQPTTAVRRLGHGLETPIAAIIGLTEALRRELAGLTAPPEDRAPVEDRAADIAVAAWRLRQLSDALRAALDASPRGPSALPAASVTEVDAPRLLRRLLRLIGPVADQQGIRIEQAEMPPRGVGPIVFCDAGDLWTALEAMLLAALESTGGEGRVQVSAIPPHTGSPFTIEIWAGETSPASPVSAGATGMHRQRAAEAAAGFGGTISASANAAGLVLSIPTRRCVDPA